MADFSTDDILFERRGAAGIVTLNRPQALNAVTHDMVLALRAQLDAGPTIRRSRASSSRRQARRPFPPAAISAIFTISARPANKREALQFWRDEYPLNAAIKNYRKPYVSLIDGIVMGGGVGVSVHGSHRVAGDRFSFAMPEVGIGFFPDVGATWFLPRMPGELGTYCALTGERFNIADGVACRHRHPSHSVGAVCRSARRPAGTVSVDAMLSAFSEPAGEGPIMAQRALIDRLFAGDSVEHILDAVTREAKAGGSEFRMGGQNRRHDAARNRRSV